MSSFPCLVRFVSGSGQVRYRLGERLVDRYLEFVAGRCRPNTLRAVAFDLKAFFAVTGKDPVEVTAADVFEFLAHQRGDRTWTVDVTFFAVHTSVRVSTRHCPAHLVRSPSPVAALARRPRRSRRSIPRLAQRDHAAADHRCGDDSVL